MYRGISGCTKTSESSFGKASIIQSHIRYLLPSTTTHGISSKSHTIYDGVSLGGRSRLINVLLLNFTFIEDLESFLLFKVSRILSSVFIHFKIVPVEQFSNIHSRCSIVWNFPQNSLFGDSFWSSYLSSFNGYLRLFQKKSVHAGWSVYSTLNMSSRGMLATPNTSKIRTTSATSNFSPILGMSSTNRSPS